MAEAIEVLQTMENLSSANKYRIEWNRILSSLSNNLHILRQLSFNGELKVSKLRSLCWALLLRVLSENSKNWIDERKQQRTRYEKLKSEFVKNPHKLTDTNDDPLSQSKQSIWNQYFGDQELFSVIKQDVVRTFPGVDFFRKDLVQEAMTNILFYYAREHPYMCYRQGMHEILAPILFVMHSDHQALLHFKETSHDMDEILLDVLNPEYLEADSYSLFSRLMSSIESYYRITNMIPTAGGYFPAQTEPLSSDENATNTEVEVIGQLNFIRDKILAKEDLHLHNHFLKLDIPLHIFGIRWLRLLFGREFPLQDLLILWDAIFADSDRFELPNYIVVAMLIRIRDKLLLGDYTTCLTLLMRYPNNVDIGLILRHALYMQMPKKYERPNEAFVYVKIKPSTEKTNHQQQQNKINKSQLYTLPRQQSVTIKHSENCPKSLNPFIGNDKFNQRNRSSSLTGSLSSSDSINTQMVNALRSNNFSNQTNDLKIIDGYRENSPEALRAELQLAQNIILLSRQKLKKYLFIIKQHIPNQNYNDELNQALTGIEELCSFLDVKFIETNDTLPQPVDAASEANEAAQMRSQKIYKIQRQGSIKNSNIAQNLQNTTQKINLQNTSIESNSNNMKINKINENEINNTASALENVPFWNKLDNNSGAGSGASNKTRYEIPDNSYMRNSTKLLGTKKDFELQLFKSEHMQENELGGIPIPDPIGIRDS